MHPVTGEGNELEGFPEQELPDQNSMVGVEPLHEILMAPFDVDVQTPDWAAKYSLGFPEQSLDG
jgi:hypothetical protein